MKNLKQIGLSGLLSISLFLSNACLAQDFSESEVNNDTLLLTHVYGEMLLEGKNNIEKNPEEAIECFKSSAKKNYIPSMIKLGQIYMEGNVVEENLELAEEYFKKGADQNDADAQYYYGLFFEQKKGDKKKAFEYFMAAALQAQADAMLAAGKYLEEGEICKKDLKTAKMFYKILADYGNEEAQSRLSNLE